MIIQVIEFVPKEFAEKAANIVSNQNLTIIKEDPIISFTVMLKGQEEKEIIYGEKNSSEKEKLSTGYWTVPSIALEKETIIDNASFKEEKEESMPTGFFALNTSDLIFWGSIIAIIVIAAVGTVIYYRNYKKKKGLEKISF